MQYNHCIVTSYLTSERWDDIKELAMDRNARKEFTKTLCVEVSHPKINVSLWSTAPFTLRSSTRLYWTGDHQSPKKFRALLFTNFRTRVLLPRTFFPFSQQSGKRFPSTNVKKLKHSRQKFSTRARRKCWVQIDSEWALRLFLAFVAQPYSLTGNKEVWVFAEISRNKCHSQYRFVTKHIASIQNF